MKSILSLIFFLLFLACCCEATHTVNLWPCQNSVGSNEFTEASWRKDPTNDMISTLDYRVCGKTSNVFSYITGATLSVEMGGVNFYSFSSKIREPSNQDIDSTNYCFSGSMKLSIPLIELPPGSSVTVKFYETDKEPLLYLCSSGN
jgi:hypothetical protein